MSGARYDVLVVGAGSAGTTAAVAAARTGARTLLVDRFGFLGGTSTAVLDTFYAFYTPGRHPEKVVSGIPDEVVARLTEREAELTSRLAEAAATQRSLEGRLADAESSLRTDNERASHDRRVAAEQAAEQQAAFQAQLEREVENRRNLEGDLARARIARDDAEKRHQSAVTAAAALRTEVDAERARAAEARETLGREARDLEASEKRLSEAQAREAEARIRQLEAELERIKRG